MPTQTPELRLDKTATPATYDAVGDVIAYSYVVTNTGNVTLAGPFTVNDDKATGDLPGTAMLAPARRSPARRRYTITQADLDAGSVTNTATGDGRTAPRLQRGHGDGQRRPGTRTLLARQDGVAVDLRRGRRRDLRTATW